MSRPRGPDRACRVDLRRAVQLLDNVPVHSQREARIVAQLARDVDHAAALVEQQRGEAVAKVIRTCFGDACGCERSSEGSPAPRLVRGLTPRLAARGRKESPDTPRAQLADARAIHLALYDAVAEPTHGKLWRYLPGSRLNWPMRQDVGNDLKACRRAELRPVSRCQR